MDDIKVFPIIISKNNESSDYPYFVEIPDIDGMTEGGKHCWRDGNGEGLYWHLLFRK